MTERAQISSSSCIVIFASLLAAIAFFYYEHTTWIFIAFIVLIAYCCRAYVQQSGTEIAQVQMHDMVDHTALHPQLDSNAAKAPGNNSSDFSPSSQQFNRSDAAAPAQAAPPTGHGPLHKNVKSETAQMPADNISSGQFSENAARHAPNPFTRVHDDFSFPNFPAEHVPSGQPPMAPLQPMAHMDPMQQVPQPRSKFPSPIENQGHNHQGRQPGGFQMDTGRHTLSQTAESKVFSNTESYSSSIGNQAPVVQHQSHGSRQQGWSSEVGDGQSTSTERGGTKAVYTQMQPTASQVPLLPEGIFNSSDERNM